MTKKPENHAENAVNQAINQAIGTTIRKIREHLDISPEKLATKTNIPKEQLCNGELGKTAFNGFMDLSYGT